MAPQCLVLPPYPRLWGAGVSHQAWQWVQGLGHYPPPQSLRPRQCLPRALLTSWVTSQRAGGPLFFRTQGAAQSSPFCWLSWSLPTEYGREEYSVMTGHMGPTGPLPSSVSAPPLPWPKGGELWPLMVNYFAISSLQ